MSKMEAQARRLGAEIRNGEIRKIEKDENSGIFSLHLADSSVVESRAVIIATGASFKKLGVPGEAEYTGRGVSYCATCDGAFFREKVTAVVGGGDTALEEAYFLTRFASKVYIFHRRDKFRGAKILQDRVLNNDKITPVYDSVVEKINGQMKVDSVNVKNVKTGDESVLDVDGVFIFVGYTPNTGFLQPEILNEKGEVLIDMQMNTTVKGLFAAGDLREGSGRQIVMAASDGAIAAMSAYDYILSLEE